MSTTTVTTGTTTTERIQRDVRGVPLQHRIGDGQPDPFIGTCPAWCDGRHGSWEHHDDRSHFGEEADIALELEGDAYDSEDRTSTVTTIRTYLQQHYREVEPRVFLGRGESRGVYLTLTEAALLRDRLTELLKVTGMSS